MIVRKFKFAGHELPDPDPTMHVDDVRKMYASQYPALTNAVITYPEGQDGGSYEFTEKGKGGSQVSGGSQTVEFKASVGRKA